MPRPIVRIAFPVVVVLLIIAACYLGWEHGRALILSAMRDSGKECENIHTDNGKITLNGKNYSEIGVDENGCVVMEEVQP